MNFSTIAIYRLPSTDTYPLTAIDRHLQTVQVSKDTHLKTGRYEKTTIITAPARQASTDRHISTDNHLQTGRYEKTAINTAHELYRHL